MCGAVLLACQALSVILIRTGKYRLGPAINSPEPFFNGRGCTGEGRTRGRGWI